MAKAHIKIENLMSPLGKGASAISMKAVQENLMNKYYKSIHEVIKIYSLVDKNDYYIFAKIPSERNSDVKHKVFYEVLLRFYPPEKTTESSMSIRAYAIEAYSNCPNFTFTFTNTFKSVGGLIDFIPVRYYSKEALKKNADVRNPMNLLGIEKSLFFTIKRMEFDNLFRKNRVKLIQMSNIRRPKDFLKLIQSQDEKLAEINKANMLNRRIQKTQSRQKNRTNQGKSVLRTNKLRAKRETKLNNNLKVQ